MACSKVLLDEAQENQTLLFLNIKTAGLPMEGNFRKKIIEMCFLAVSREEFEAASISSLPRGDILCFLVNPQCPMSEEVEQVTGLTDKMLSKEPTFKKKCKDIDEFLNKLQKPVCLVAHNGVSFDFKVLLTECRDAHVKLPEGLRYIDSRYTIQRIFKERNGEEKRTSKLKKVQVDNEEGDLQKDEEYKKEKQSYKLGDLYTQLLKIKPKEMKRAETDCRMMLGCAVKLKNEFLAKSDGAYKMLKEVTPLHTYVTFKEEIFRWG